VLFLTSAGLDSGFVSGFASAFARYPLFKECIWNGFVLAEKTGETARVNATVAPRATVVFFLFFIFEFPPFRSVDELKK
jgi:hypothetical protein